MDVVGANLTSLDVLKYFFSRKLTFTGGCGGYVVGGWLDQVGIRLSRLSTKLKLKLKLSLAIFTPLPQCNNKSKTNIMGIDTMKSDLVMF